MRLLVRVREAGSAEAKERSVFASPFVIVGVQAQKP